jgi:hypothetical protein
MALWIGGALAWQTWLMRPVAPINSAVGTAATPKEDLPLLYATAGRRILQSYRNSSDPKLQDFDWHKAELYLEHAVELGGSDDQILGELALSRGYATLDRLGSRYSPSAAAILREYARTQFNEAAEKLPRSPDPHLALARLYVYWLPDTAKAMAEFEQAERLGATLGQREFAQQADAYRNGSIQKLARVNSTRRVHRKSHKWR